MEEMRTPLSRDGKFYTQPEEERLDILGRDEFINRLMKVISVISSSKNSCTLAINGKWGTGKTFVLNILEQRLNRERAGEQYLVFYYNCWQYDYYEEPLFAIVSAIIDGVKKQERFFPKSIDSTVKAIVGTIGEILLDVTKESGKNLLKVHTGFDITLLEKLYAHFSSKKADIATKKAEKMFDNYSTFNMRIEETREQLTKLAKDRTLVYIVDELDRCLPNYTVKVMERLHHLFDNLPNTITIMAIDKNQMQNTIMQIYGPNIEMNAYLRKFINVEMTLNTGSLKEGFTEKYKEYVSLFDLESNSNDFSIDCYCSAIFYGIEIRTQEQLIERIKTIHKILFSNDSKKDLSFMCFELMMICLEYKNIHYNPINVIVDDNWEKKEFPVTFLGNSNFNSMFDTYVREWGLDERVTIRFDRFDNKRKLHVYPKSNIIDIPYLLSWYSFKLYPYEIKPNVIQMENIVYHEIIVELSDTTIQYNQFMEYIKDFQKISSVLKIVQ